MNATRQELTKQFNSAANRGWLRFFVEAVKTFTNGFFDEADLLAIASRETNIDPKWLTKPGDGGNGFGLMQADARSFPDWIRSGKWKDAREGVLMGARVLMMKWKDTQDCIGKRVSVKSMKSGTLFTFIGKRVEGAEAQTVVIAAYNGGRWAHFAVSKGQNASKYTTGGDYATDVQQRAAFFRPLVEQWKRDNGLMDEPDTALASASEPVADNSRLTGTNVGQSSGNSTDDSILSGIDFDTAKRRASDAVEVVKRPSVKGLLKVVLSKLVAYLVFVWETGVSGKIALVLGALLAVSSLGYAIYYYRVQIKSAFRKIKNGVSKSFKGENKNENA